ncbi:hypothetical protein [Agromyces seonyuensis]|uniref:Uncharacterized protein n=1 Tax=Agromyces seonyuensis TaxID=2662446 RepID=A0A6I4P6C8_9MICO|nr:hypothetical protein [Agromyces seonyuensis]MWB99147.1 hypothetical protein [Agromyces seonyuensis]
MLGRPPKTTRDARERISPSVLRRTRVFGLVAAVGVGALAVSGLALAAGTQAGLRSLDGVIAGGTFDPDRDDSGSSSVPGDAGSALPESSETPTPSTAPTPSAPPTSAPPTTDAPDVPATDPMSPEYNPYTTVGDPAYLTEGVRREWLGQEAVVRDCMSAAGFEYLPWQWWYGGSPLPTGLSADEEAAWYAAYAGGAADGAATSSAFHAEPVNESEAEAEQGTDAVPETAEPPVTEPPVTPTPEPTPDPTPDPTPTPDPGGCRAVGQAAAEAAVAAGAPLAADLPAAPGPEVPTEREAWLAFQDEVRACMSSAGFEYRYWQYWNPAYTAPPGGILAAEPEGLDEATRAAWQAALYGAAGSAPSEGGGCWASGMSSSGYRAFA